MIRLLLFGSAWLLLTEGSLSGWPLGAAVVILAARASLALQPAGTWSWRPWALLRFAPFFIAQSAAGGFDVARRAFDPRLPLNPGPVEFPTRLPPGPARQFLVAAVGLLPGTLTAHVESDRLIIHVLDRTSPYVRTLRALEARTAALYGLSLE